MLGRPDDLVLITPDTAHSLRWLSRETVQHVRPFTGSLLLPTVGHQEN